MEIRKDNIVQKMQELALKIEYEPNDIRYLAEAIHCQVVHKEGDGKNRKNYTNDAYATLGDSILKFVLTEYLFEKGYDKYEITKKKQSLEDNKTLFSLCEKSGIWGYAYNDKYFMPDAPKENQVPHGQHNPYIEAIIAAIYKDRGINYCREWIIKFFSKHNVLTD